MKDIIQINENNICVSANCIYTEDDKTIEHEFTDEDERKYFFENIKYFKYVDDELVEMTEEEKEQLYPPIEPQPSQLDRIEQSIEDVKNMRENEIIDKYTLELIENGVIF